MEFAQLFELLKDAGLPGLAVGLLVLIVVYILSFTELLKVGWMKRLAAVALTYLFAGVEDVESGLVGAIALIVATGIKLGLDAIKAYKPNPG